eukprot:1987728-Pyramimonas_sp.AAC.1
MGLHAIGAHRTQLRSDAREGSHVPRKRMTRIGDGMAKDDIDSIFKSELTLAGEMIMSHSARRMMSMRDQHIASISRRKISRRRGGT